MKSFIIIIHILVALVFLFQFTPPQELYNRVVHSERYFSGNPVQTDGRTVTIISDAGPTNIQIIPIYAAGLVLSILAILAGFLVFRREGRILFVLPLTILALASIPLIYLYIVINSNSLYDSMYFYFPAALLFIFFIFEALYFTFRKMVP